MCNRFATVVVLGLCLWAPFVRAQDFGADTGAQQKVLRRMLDDPPDVRREFPRVDPPGFTLDRSNRFAERLDPLRDFQKLLPGDVDPSAMDFGYGGVFCLKPNTASDALDLLARDILRWQRRKASQRHPLTVVWLFDQSRSMIDDRQTMSAKLSRILPELDGLAISHLVFEFGKSCRRLTPVPAQNADAVKDAFEQVTIDWSGVENTFHAIMKAMREAREVAPQGSQLLLVVVTDESGNDDRSVEDAHSSALHGRVPIYVIGRQALFGMSEVRVTSSPNGGGSHTIRCGPESADIEVLAWDGVQPRDDEQPSGFAPYGLARLVHDTGGIYLMLPTEESLRVKRREKAYSIADLRGYAPESESRETYVARRERSVLRRTLYETIQMTRDYFVPLRFANAPRPIEESLANAADRAERQLAQLGPIEARLRELQRERDREPSRRWQSNYDLMLAQIVAFQVTLREYRAALFALRRKTEAEVDGPWKVWDLGHGRQRQAPEAGTKEGYAEAERLLALVIERHPHTPWADLAQTIRERGLSVEFREACSDGPPRPTIEPVNY